MGSTWSDDESPPPRAPRSEPEILPPERSGQQHPASGPIWVGQHRIVFTRPGPFQLLLGLVVLGVIVAVGALALLGLFLLSLPLMGAAIVAVFLAALLRGSRRI